MIKHIHLIVYGAVQGVNYRWGALQLALRLKLVGWVRNAVDGTVEIVAEGAEDDLAELMGWCQVGPRGARVERLEAVWSDTIEGFKEFRITR